MVDAVDPIPPGQPAPVPAGAGVEHAIAAHMRRNRSLYVAFGLGIVAVGVATVFWVQHPSTTFAAHPVATASADDVEAMYDWQIEQNLLDFNRWYKTNIVIQALTIALGIFSTVFASLATQEDAVLRRRAVVVLTALTTALVAIQSTFHIKDNLDTFIKANSDLQVSKVEYAMKRDGASDPDNKAKTTTLQLRADTLNSLVRITESRMRAYSGIGAQQARGASADVVRDGEPKHGGPDAGPPAAGVAATAASAETRPSTTAPAMPPTVPAAEAEHLAAPPSYSPTAPHATR